MTRRDPLLEALAQRLREQDDLADPRWEALPSGALPAEDEAELAEQARRGEAPRAAYDAFRPISAEERAAVAEGALAEIARRKRAAVPVPAAPILKRPRRAIYAVAAAVLAAAAAFALIHRPAPAPVAAYLAFVDDAGQRDRPYVKPSETPHAGPLTLQGQARVHVTLRPETTVEGPVEVRAFLVAGGQARPVALSVEAGPHGTVRLPGLRRETFGDAADGAHDLALVVGRPDAWPADTALRAWVAQRARAGRPGIQVVTLPLILGPR